MGIIKNSGTLQLQFMEIFLNGFSAYRPAVRRQKQCCSGVEQLLPAFGQLRYIVAKWRETVAGEYAEKCVTGQHNLLVDQQRKRTTGVAWSV